MQDPGVFGVICAIVYDAGMAVSYKGVLKTLSSKKALILFVSIIPFLLLTAATGVLQGTDDSVLRAGLRGSPLDWVQHQYVTWSGRITAETLVATISQLPVGVWRIAQAILYCALALTLYKYYKLFAKDISEKKDLIMVAVCALLPLTIGVGALRWGAFWITGSLNYFWIAVLGLIAFYPILRTYLKLTNPPRWLMAIGIVFAVLAGMGQEQAFLLLVLASWLIVASLYYQTKKIWVYPIVQSVVTTIAAAISYLAPGNKHRLELETNNYIPNFETVSLIDKFNWSYRWIIDALINNLGYVLVLTWILIIVILLAQRHKHRLLRVDYLVIGVLSFSALLYTRITNGLNIFNFYVAWGVNDFPKASYLYILFWTFVLTVMFIGLYRVSRIHLNRGVFLPALALLMVLGVSAMVMSPTMYASGPRTLLTPSLVGVLLLVILITLATNVYKKYQFWPLILVGFVALIHFSTLIKILVQSFNAF